jgi:hypothetical protein
MEVPAEEITRAILVLRGYRVLLDTELAARAVLKGKVDFLSLRPPNRWVGGVQIGAELPDWRWNEQSKNAVRPNLD